MKKMIQLLFGKPFKKENSFISKYFRFTYWGMIAFYFFSLSLLGLSTFYNISALTGLVIWGVFLPVTFRLTYNLVGKLNGLEKEG
ncbi:hypothetical protein [Neobacillus sp. LXY-4]|uniref:hypothetical protein n=1 Tax=Neobacillus sp. LXY-4 TaxID=3379826 RepID=UPI003EE07DA8